MSYEMSSVTPSNNKTALASLILGILGWVLFVFTNCAGFVLTFMAFCVAPLGCVVPLLWIAGIITGHVGMSQIKSSGEGGRGMAIAGLIMSYVGLGLMIIFACVIVILIATGASLPILDEIMQQLNINL